MRWLAVLLLLPLAMVHAAAPPAPVFRLDVNGDRLPTGAVARLGSLRFQPHDPYSDRQKRWFRTSIAPALSPDGTTLAAASVIPRGGVRIEFLDVSTGKRIRMWVGTDSTATQIQFTPDGKQLVCTNGENLQIVDPTTGRMGRSIPIGSPESYSVALTADGKWAAVQPKKYVRHAPVMILDLKTGKQVQTLPGRGAVCQSLAFGPGGKRLLLLSLIPDKVSDNGMSVSNDSPNAVACIDVAARKIIGEIKVNSNRNVALGPDGETVAFEAADHQSVRLRHLPTGAERFSLPVKGARLAFAPDGKMLLTLDERGQCVLWDTTRGTRIRELEGRLASKEAEIVGVSKDGKIVVALDGGWESAARFVVWNAVTGQRVPHPPGHDGRVTCIAYAPDGKQLVSGSIDRTIRLWDAGSGKHLRLLTTHAEPVQCVAVSHDGKLAASSSQDGQTKVSRIADGKMVAEFAGPTKGAKALAFSPDDKVLFMGGESPEVIAREIRGGKEKLHLKTGPDGEVTSFGMAGAAALIANGQIRIGPPEELHVWDLTQRQRIASLSIRDEKEGRVHCAAGILSLEGRMIASSQVSEYQGIRPTYGNPRLHLWERVSGQPIRTLAPIVSPWLAFSPNGRLLASGAAGHSGHLSVGYGEGIDIWDTLTGEKVASLPVTPRCVAFSPDGKHLATAGRDHCVLIWKAPSPRQSKKGKASANERDAWWTDLGRNATDAYPAMGRMLDAPADAVALLKEQLQPVKRPNAQAVGRWIAQLDSEAFTEREKAHQALEKLGEAAEPLLRKALEGNPSLELHRRVQRLLKLCSATSVAGLRQHRGVAVLEWIDTPAALRLLRTLADGAPGARLTTEAQAAWKRQGGR